MTRKLVRLGSSAGSLHLVKDPADLVVTDKTSRLSNPI
jgi:hypothetical protein